MESVPKNYKRFPEYLRVQLRVQEQKSTGEYTEKIGACPSDL
jgi:hypothetical protein